MLLFSYLVLIHTINLIIGLNGNIGNLYDYNNVVSDKSNYFTNQTPYIIRDFDIINRTCYQIYEFMYDSTANFSKIFLSDDQDTNINYRHILAIKNDSVFVLFNYEENLDRINKLFIKDFKYKIILLEPKWLFNRIYIATHNIKDNLINIYEIDTYYGIFSLITSFNSSISNFSSLKLIADPLQGSITYSYDNHISIFSVNYLNEKNFYKNAKSKYVENLYEIPYESFFYEKAVCRKFPHFDFVTSSSEIDGYASIQTYYIKSVKPNIKEDLRCIIYNGECTCIPINSKEVKSNFNDYYNYYNSNQCFEGKNKTHEIVVLNKRSNFNPSIYKTFKKECMRICRIAEWKRKLQNLNKTYDLNHKDLPCVNNLPFDSFIEQFGIAHIKNDSIDSIYKDEYKLMVNLYNDYLSELLSDCANLEIMLKYSVVYKKINFTSNSNNVPSEKKTSFDSSISVTLEKFHSYEIIIEIQTPIDQYPYLIGPYYIKNIRSSDDSNIVEPNFKALQLKNNPFIYAKYWAELIKDNLAYIKFISQIPENEFSIETLEFLLVNKDSNQSLVSKLSDTFQPIISNVDKVNSNRQIIFMLNNLTEDTTYSIKIIDNSEKDEIGSISNVLTFKTLKKPLIEIINLNNDNVDIRIKLACRLDIEDLDLNYIQKYNENVCNYFKIFIKEANLINATRNISEEWLMKYESFVEEHTDGQQIVTKELKISNLSSNTDYLIKAQVELFFMYDSPLLDSEIIRIKTGSPKYFFLAFILLLASLIVIFTILIILKLKKRKVNRKRSRPQIIDLLEYESSKYDIASTELLDKMNINTIYYRSKYRTSLLENLSKVTSIDEDRISPIKYIGKGEFGEVYKGILKQNDNTIIYVAIKKLKQEANESEKNDIIKEALLLNSINHKNLLHLHGICMDEQKNIKYIILEYMNMGDLLNYLRSSRSNINTKLSFRAAIKICLEIAEGCSYLEKLQLVHRDIAARNCLINNNDVKNNKASFENSVISVKIGDFGLAKDVYSKDYYKPYYNQKPMPIRWMSPESIFDAIYTTKSDVWSYGVLVWEVITLGYQPYLGLDNIQVIDYIKNGFHLKISNKCPAELRELMLNCWIFDYKKRINFAKICDDLEKIYKLHNSKRSNDNTLDNLLPLDDF